MGCICGAAHEREHVGLRSEKMLKNTAVGVIAQIVYSLADWITCTVFIKTMTDQYRGAQGLFASILSFLSLAELGIGSVLVYSMYKPIAENDERKLTALTQFYRKAYNIIGAMIFGVGLCLTPFLPFFVDDMDAVPHASLIYLMYLFNSVLSYMFVYKQSILNADQKNYVINFRCAILNAMQCAFQVLVLITTHNFFAFLGVQMVFTLSKNIIVSHKAGKMYPFLNTKEKISLTKEERHDIYKNVFAMFNHRVGGTVLNSTDNLLITKFIGLVYCGFYNNFKMIVNVLNSFLNQFFTAMMSSVGSLTASESKETSYRTFKYLHFLSFWMYTFCTICFIELANPFIMVWLGKEKYTFGFPTVLMIGLNFYVVGIRKVPLTFKEAMGLLWQDRVKPIIEAVINIVISIAFIERMGIAGILLGTIVSMVVTSLWVEPHVLFKHGFQRSSGEFWRRNIIYFAFSGGLLALVHYIDSLFALTGWTDLFAKFGVCLIVPNVIIAICFCFTGEFKDLFAAISGMLASKFHRKDKVTA